jgi:uncharacterized PurR-regulated membrane protein YhhQ (DUF165 family)
MRIVLGSLLAFVAAMSLNNYLYSVDPKRTLIVKYLMAIGIAQIVDTIIFHFVAYLGIVALSDIFGSIGSTIIFKSIITLFSIPIFLGGLRGYSYLGVKLESKIIH